MFHTLSKSQAIYGIISVPALHKLIFWHKLISRISVNDSLKRTSEL